MNREIDKEGQVEEPLITPAGDGELPGPLLLEIPLWRFGRLKLESYSLKSSLAVFALIITFVMVLILSPKALG